MIEEARTRLLRWREGHAKPTKRAPSLQRPAYENRHSGETLLVLGTGPSLAEHEAPLRRFLAAARPLTLAGNHITPFLVPDYHAFTNRKRFAQYAHTIDPARSRVLLSPYFTDELLALYYDGPFERIAYVADDDASFGVRRGIIQASCFSVSVLLVGVAIVMGAGPIYVAGLDGFAPALAAPEGPSVEESLYFAGTELLKRRHEQYVDIDRYTRRFLAEIQAYLAREGREPFAIVTPTTYAEHYRPEVLAQYA